VGDAVEEKKKLDVLTVMTSMTQLATTTVKREIMLSTRMMFRAIKPGPAIFDWTASMLNILSCRRERSR